MALGGVEEKQELEISVVVGAPGEKIGTSIKPETVKEEVEIAQEVEPAIAAQAQADLDTQKQTDDAAEQEAEEHLKIQEARKSDEQKRQEQSLQAALSKLRKDETPEQHAQRLKDEEKARLAAEHNAAGVAQKLGHDAAEVAISKLPGIEAKAQAELDHHQAEVDGEEHQAEEDKAANEAHDAALNAKRKSDEQRHSAEATVFTKPSTQNAQLARISQTFEDAKKKKAEGGKPAGKVEQLAAKLEEAPAEEDKALPEVGKSNVAALVTQFQTKKEEAKQNVEPRRSGRISELVKKKEAEQKAAAREIKVVPKKSRKR
ncbi:MAG: hypothetical protein JSR17_07655 [Proteobacteria bacterium]|nr:hypothetical protein [Pseudomonadota bacterium]